MSNIFYILLLVCPIISNTDQTSNGCKNFVEGPMSYAQCIARKKDLLSAHLEDDTEQMTYNAILQCVDNEIAQSVYKIKVPN